MSLINQALRKAQQDRNPKRMTPSGEPSAGPAHQMSASSSGMKPGILIGLIAAVALLIGLVAGLTVVILKDSPPAPAQPQTQALQALAPAPSVATAPAPPTITPTQTAAVAPSIPSVIAPQAAAPTQASAPSGNSVLDQLRVAREAAEAKAAEEAAIAAEAKRIAELDPNQDVIDWLSDAKVTGVRLSGDDSKAIINNKAYTKDELVHYSLGIKLVVIQETRLLFEDANGKRYMKRL
jgi:hypothetical protein